MKGIRFLRRLLPFALLFILAVPAFAQDATAKIMVSSGGYIKSFSGDLNRFDVPQAYFGGAFAGEAGFALANLALTWATTEKEEMLFAVIPAIGVRMPPSLSFFNVFAMAGLGPYWYDKKVSFIIDFAAGAELHFGGFFLNITNHIDYMAGFKYWAYRLMGGIGFAF